LKNPADSEVQGARLNLLGVLWEEWGDDVLTSTRGGGVRGVGMLGGKKGLSKLMQLQSCAGQKGPAKVFGLLPAGAAKVIQEGALAGRFCSVERIERLFRGWLNSVGSTARRLHSGRSKL
jgi:hypothetical protein